MNVLKQRSKFSLPDDLIPEILSRLPVKSLLRFRCISNSWLSLIDDSKFAGLQLTRYKNRRDGEFDLFAQVSRGSCVDDSQIEYALLCGKTLTIKARFDPPTVLYSIVSVSDGLVVLLDRIECKVLLWNPSIRKTRLLPKFSEMPIPAGTTLENFGVGFSSAINDYKYVAHTRINGIRYFVVYTLGTNSWKLMIEFHNEQVSYFNQFLLGNRSALCVEGVLYGINRNLNVISFDLGCDTYCSFSLPDDCSNSKRCICVLTLGYGGRSLAMVRLSDVGGSIWVRQTTTWVKLSGFVVTSPPMDIWNRLLFLHLSINGELLFKWMTVFKRINLETQEEKVIPKTCATKSVRSIWQYTESLFMLK